MIFMLNGMPSTYLNLSMQLTPLGSSLLYTKQLKASLNCSPHGPCAIPPRHGQSQLISPVSSLKAPSSSASSSSASGDDCDASEAGAIGGTDVLGATGLAAEEDASLERVCDVGCVGAVVISGWEEDMLDEGAAAIAVCLCRRDSAIDSRVGSFAS